VWHSKKKGLLAMGHGDDADVVGQEVGGSGDIGWPLPASTFSSLLMTFCRRCCWCFCCCCCWCWCYCYSRCCCWNRNFLVVVTRPIVLVAAVAAVVDGVQMKTFPIIAVSCERLGVGDKEKKSKKKRESRLKEKSWGRQTSKWASNRTRAAHNECSVHFGLVWGFCAARSSKLPHFAVPPRSLI